MKFGQTQQMNACSKTTIETLEKGVNDETNVFLVSLLLTLNIFHIFFSVSIVSFEQANVVCWKVNSDVGHFHYRLSFFDVNFEQLVYTLTTYIYGFQVHNLQCIFNFYC